MNWKTEYTLDGVKFHDKNGSYNFDFARMKWRYSDWDSNSFDDLHRIFKDGKIVWIHGASANHDWSDSSNAPKSDEIEECFRVWNKKVKGENLWEVDRILLKMGYNVLGLETYDN
jgi:hypothetical protein